MIDKRFNIRVYGILVNERNEILISDERYKGVEFTKFPGGGLQWGEGPIECLKREFKEELNQPISVMEHVFTTDFFQRSAFRENDQLISLYYRVGLIGEPNFGVVQKPFDFPPEAPDKTEVYRWVNISELAVSDFSWPIDKHVFGILKKGLA